MNARKYARPAGQGQSKRNDFHGAAERPCKIRAGRERLGKFEPLAAAPLRTPKFIEALLRWSKSGPISSELIVAVAGRDTEAGKAARWIRVWNFRQ